MKIFLAAVLLLGLLNPLIAQSSKADSLLALIDKAPNDSLQAYYNRLLGVEYKKLGQYDKAIESYLEALEMNKKLGILPEQAKCYNNLGSIYTTMGDYESALESYLNSLRVNENLGNLDGQIKNYINLGNFFARQQDFEKAGSYYEKALSLLTPESKLKDEALLSMNLGGLNTDPRNKQADPDKAVFYFEKAKKAFAVLHDSVNLAGIANNLGVLKEKQGKQQEAFALYSEALELRKRVGDLTGLAQSYHNLGNILRDIKKFEEAKKMYDQSLATARKINARAQVKNALLNLSKTMADMGQHELAYEYHLSYEEVKDSLLNEEVTHQLAELETKYETEKKEQELMVKEASLRQKTAERNTYMITLGVTLLLSLVIIIIYHQRQRAVTQLAAQKEELLQRQITEMMKDHEIKSINAMLEGQDRERKRIAEDLHDRLGSTLSAVKLHLQALEVREQGGTAVGLYEKVDELLDTAVTEVRDIAHNMVSGVLTKFGLSAALYDLKDTVEASSRIKLNLEILHLDERLEGNVEINLYRVVQELVSNILKHARATEITIQLNKLEHELVLMVEDDGIGFEVERARQGKGMGMRNVESRVEALGGKVYPDSSPGNGSTFTVLIPLT